MIREHFDVDTDPSRFLTGITGKKDFTIISLSKRGMSNQVGVLRRVLTVLERHNISVDYVPNGIDNVSVVLPTEAVASSLYTILGEIQKEVEILWMSTTRSPWLPPSAGRWPSAPVFPARSSPPWARPVSISA